MNLALKKFKKIGLALGGGGGKGAYQIGILKALHQYGLLSQIDAMAGTSVGALNMMLALKNNPHLWTYLWRCEVENAILYFNEKTFNENFKQLSNLITYAPSLIQASQSPLKVNTIFKEIDFKVGIFSHSGLKKIIEDNLSIDLITNSQIELFVCASRFSKKEAHYFNLKNYSSFEEIVAILLASSAIPGVFQHHNIDGHSYVDGGLTNSLPIKPLVDCGCDLIITSPLHQLKAKNLGDYRVNLSEWPTTTFVELVPEKNLGGHWGVLDFSRSNARKLIEDGYNEQQDIIEAISHLITKETSVH